MTLLYGFVRIKIISIGKESTISNISTIRMFLFGDEGKKLARLRALFTIVPSTFITINNETNLTLWTAMDHIFVLVFL